MADTLTLRKAIAEGRDAQGPDRSARDDPGARQRRRSRSRDRRPPRRRGPERRRARSRSPRQEQPKPDLWAAVERGDEAVVQGLLEDASKNPEERFEGWTPLMKAAEENKDSIMRLLLDRSA